METIKIFLLLHYKVRSLIEAESSTHDQIFKENKNTEKKLQERMLYKYRCACNLLR